MRICVFLGSKYGNNPKFKEMTEQLGREIAGRGHSLIFGGSNAGLMKSVAESFMELSDDIIGVEPDTPFIRKKVHPALKNVIWEDTMSQRKITMIEKADAFIVMPGGPGTFDELGEVLQMIKTDTIDKPLVLFNIDGFYDPMITFFDNMKKEDFWCVSDGRVLISGDLEEIFKFIETPMPPKNTVAQ